MNNTDTIRDKIAHLMAMGQDERTNQFEAEAALRQAEKLMRKHAIDAAEIQARTGTKPVYNWQRIMVPANNPPAKNCVGWFSSLGCAVAKFTDCAAAWKRSVEHGMCIELRGDAVDVAYAVYLLKHLRDATRAESSRFAGSRREREDFRVAMVSRISVRMAALKREQREALREAEQHSTGSALVVVDNKIALRDAALGAPKYGTSIRRGSDHFAANAGAAAGNRVGFGRPVGRDSYAAIGAGE